jgi:hypothetical protein
MSRGNDRGRAEPLWEDGIALGLFVARESFSPPESAFPLVRNQTSDQGSPAVMTLDASTQPTPTAVTSVEAALQLPVIFGVEVLLDFPVALVDQSDQTKARFYQTGRLQLSARSTTMNAIVCS